MNEANKEEPEATQALTIVNSPTELMHRAKNVADVCREVVEKLAIRIKGKKYLPVEAWQTIAAAYGFAAGARDVVRAPTGWSAVGELRRISDGLVIATAEGFVGDDEKWGAEYACRAKAQTRAISRVCRSAFAFVVVLISKDLATTPAEEMPHEPEEKHDRSGRKTELKKPDSDAGRQSAIASLQSFLDSNKIPSSFLMQTCYEANLADGSEEKIDDLKDGVLQRFCLEKWRVALLEKWKARPKEKKADESKPEIPKNQDSYDSGFRRTPNEPDKWKRPMTTLPNSNPAHILEMAKVAKWQDVPIIRGANKDVLLGDLTPAQLRHYITRWTPTKDEEGSYEDEEIIMDAALSLAAQEQ